jgi:alkylhydroperoxidase family enzyme
MGNKIMTNTLFKRTSRDKLPEELTAAWDYLNGRTGDATFIEVFASAPNLLNFVMGDFYQKIFFGGNVALKYKELVRLRLSVAHGCLTCNKQNRPGCLEAGFTQEQVNAIDDAENGPFSDDEKAVIAYAEQMILTNLDGTMSPDLYVRLKKYFSDADILELGTCMAIVGGMAKLSFVLNLVEKEEYCPFAPAAE